MEPRKEAVPMYKIQPGDYLALIAQKHKVRIEDILRANPAIIDPDRLKLGQTLTIPSSTSSYRPLAKGQGRKESILTTLRQGSAMSTTAFYSDFEHSLSAACVFLSCASFDRTRFHEAYRNEFGAGTLTQKQADGLNLLLRFIERDPDMTNLKMVAYLLATIHHETGWPVSERYSPIVEYGDKDYFNRYDPVLASTEKLRSDAKLNGNTAEGDGYKYRGRGYVQLTWKNNYKKCADKFGRDLVNNPDLALEPQLSYNITSWGMRAGIFRKRKIGEFIYGAIADYTNARQVVNAMDDAELIAGYADRFERILIASIED